MHTRVQVPVGAKRGHWIFWQAVVSVWVMGSEFWLSAGASREPNRRDKLQPLVGKFETADSWTTLPGISIHLVLGDGPLEFAHLMRLHVMLQLVTRYRPQSV